MKNSKEIISFFSKTFLFNGLDDAKIDDILNSMQPELIEYKKGEIVFAPTDYKRRLGFVFEGECEIQRYATDGGVPLNNVCRYGSFGIMSLFSDKDEYPTIIIAKRNSMVFWFSRDSIMEALKNNPELSLKIIFFMAERIEFLNSKISTFSMGDCESKVAKIILNKSESAGSNIIDFNCKNAAEMLNIGRASLYRALNSLTEAGIIQHENKKIIIKDPYGLKGISK